MQDEFERKFIVPNISSLPFELKKYKSSHIKQGFFSGLPSPLRIREKDGEYTLTKKYPQKDKSHLVEVELPLKKSEFRLLYPKVIKKIEKIRYYIKYKTNTIELDVFGGRLKGLIIAEIEFKSLAEMNCFVKPDFLGFEISGFKWATNSRLADMSYSKVKKILKKQERLTRAPIID